MEESGQIGLEAWLPEPGIDNQIMGLDRTQEVNRFTKPLPKVPLYKRLGQRIFMTWQTVRGRGDWYYDVYPPVLSFETRERFSKIWRALRGRHE